MLARPSTLLGQRAWLALLVGALAHDAAAQPAEPQATDQCVAAMKDGQVLRDGGALLAARDAFVRCEAASCPEIITRKCSAWRAEVAALVPTLSIVVRGEGVAEPLEATVYVDELERGARGPIELDPGLHRVRVVVGDRVEAREVELAPGDRVELVVALALPPAPIVATPVPAPAPPPSPAMGTAPAALDGPAWPVAYAAFAVGGAALVVGVVTGAVTLARAGELEDVCASAEGCPQADIDDARVVAHVATGSFVVAGVGVVVGVIAAVIAAMGEGESGATSHLGADARGFVIRW
jgi:hypothetical protein